MTEAIIILLIFLSIIIIIILIAAKRKKKNLFLTSKQKDLLLQHVNFYRDLDEEGRKKFELRMAHFLSDVRITGIRTEIDDLDRVLVAASAIIPSFGFDNWEYINLNEVLVYPDNFNSQFEIEGPGRDLIGIVGWGAIQNTMVISKHGLHEGFLNKTGKQNTGIHEFVHLIDKTDGATDGIPENIMNHQYIIPWLDLMQKKINEIREGESDINPYGATNQAEFFAVVSEYFFERPDLLKTNHPELYKLLEKIFRQAPIKNND